MEMELNPYAAPQAQVLQASNHDELVRTEHLDTEAAIKSVGLLYYIAAFGLVILGASVLVGETPVKASTGWLPALLLPLGVAAGGTAYGLKRLQGWARIPTIILSSIALVLGLISVSIVGVLIHIYVLTKVLGKQGQFVMTPEYKRIIAATPHIKRKTSIVVKVLLVLLLITLIGIIAAISIK